ncbi:nucleotidyl transferase AbiEii/AbiGii toxin family protein [Candidatus Roizmanbacteria bacterium]|nr:nucleotidyl transferase AbiEii/AbiGii toxin family protein [Candidatus Roizmanbacteria bacterium]
MEKGEGNPKGGGLFMNTYHKAQLFRLLIEMLDSPIAKDIYFKGGSAAAMLGFLDRFSVDLDFDLKPKADKKTIDKNLRKIFRKLNLKIHQKSNKSLFYLLKYSAKPGLRNTIKLSLVDTALKSNLYSSFYLSEIDRFAFCQTPDTMFANKLVAVTNRYKKHKMIAGRDIYDIHHFFLSGFHYNEAVIKERTNKQPADYFKGLIKFIDSKVTEKVINEDLSFLLTREKFQLVRKVLKRETLMFLKNEITKLTATMGWE